MVPRVTCSNTWCLHTFNLVFRSKTISYFSLLPISLKCNHRTKCRQFPFFLTPLSSSFAFLFPTHLYRPVFHHHPFSATLPWSFPNKLPFIHQCRRTAIKSASIFSPNVWIVDSLLAFVVSGTTLVVLARDWKRWRKGSLSTPFKREPSRGEIHMEFKISQVKDTVPGTVVKIIWWKFINRNECGTLKLIRAQKWKNHQMVWPVLYIPRINSSTQISKYWC